MKKKTFSPERKGLDAKLQGDQKHIPIDWWFEDVCMLDMDYFVRTIAAIKSKGVRPVLIGAIISHYACKWLPGLVQEHEISASLLQNDADGKKNGNAIERSESFSSSQSRNKCTLETLISILPGERDAVSCSFLLRLLRMANILGADSVYKMELEKRIGPQLDQATISDLLIPSFSHRAETLFDIELVYRLVKRFLDQNENAAAHTASTAAGRFMGPPKLVTSMVKVAKLMDSYLTEIAYDANLDVSSFEALADSLPYYARTCNDGLYRAVDTYLKAHAGISDAERRRLCRLMDCQKLSADASFHAAQNERLPIRTVVHVLFCEQMKLRNGKTVEETATSLRRKPSMEGQCHSLHECSNVVDQNPSQIAESHSYIENHSSIHLEIQKIREDFAKLQHFCNLMQQKVDKTCKQKSSSPWSNGWKKIARLSSQFQSSKNRNAAMRAEQCSVSDDVSVETLRQPQVQMTQTRHKGICRRHSLS